MVKVQNVKSKSRAGQLLPVARKETASAARGKKKSADGVGQEVGDVQLGIARAVRGPQKSSVNVSQAVLASPQDSVSVGARPRQSRGGAAVIIPATPTKGAGIVSRPKKTRGGAAQQSVDIQSSAGIAAVESISQGDAGLPPNEAPSSIACNAPDPLRHGGRDHNVTPSAVAPVVAESFSQTGGDPYPVVAHEQTVAAVSDSSQDEGGQGSNVAHDKIAVLIPEIKETHRRRQAFHRAEKSLTLQIKAIERRLLGVTALTSPEKKLLPAASPELSPSPANKRPSSSVGMPAPDSTLQDQQTASQSVPPIYQMQSAGPFLQESLSAFRKVPAHTALRSEDSIDSTSPDAIHELDTEDQTRPAASPEMEEVILFATLPLIEARESIKKHRLKAERLCAKLAEQLPVYKTFIEPVVGLGALGLAQIIGECGDLRNYANPAKLWKRMGLAVIDGKAHKRVKGEQTGYSPERRAVIFRIADSLLRQQNAFKELYVTRKVFEQQKVPEGPKMLWHRRSQRYVQKRLLRDLWRAWRVS